MTEIKYNGSVVANFEGGNTATLPVKDKKMKSDIVITVPESGDKATPIEVSTEAEMTALLTSGEVGGVYKYTGTTGTYENGALYVLEEEAVTDDELAGTWQLNSTLTFPSGFTGYKIFRLSGTYNGCTADDGVFTEGLIIDYLTLFADYSYTFSIHGTDTYYASDFEEYQKIANRYYRSSDGYVSCQFQDGQHNYYSPTSSNGIKARTFTITSKEAEVTDGNILVAWLKANATKQ